MFKRNEVDVLTSNQPLNTENNRLYVNDIQDSVWVVKHVNKAIITYYGIILRACADAESFKNLLKSKVF